MSRWMLSALCVAVAASPLSAEPAQPNIAGRWQGPSYRVASLSPGCPDGQCMITLDIAPCGEGWCGIEVTDGKTCGATALKLGRGEAESSHIIFEGKLELARNTEPYTVQAYLSPAAGDASETLEIIGDTGGEFRVFRRSFPFHTQLARTGEAVCRGEKPVS